MVKEKQIKQLQEAFINDSGFIALACNEDTDITKPLYHYTTLDGFMGILNARDFWVSNIRFLNDKMEFENGKRLCIKYLEEKIKNESDCSEYFDLVLESCKRKQEIGFKKINSDDIFSLSFCKSGDALTLWQVYGKNGISIGFQNDISSVDNIVFVNEDEYNYYQKKDKDNRIHKYKETYFITRRSIIYDDDKKIQIIDNVLNRGREYLDMYGENLKEQVVEVVSNELFKTFMYMKDDNFKYEQECRVIFDEPEKREWIHYRTRNDIILPYIKVKILNGLYQSHEKLPICDIVVSPSERKDYIADSIKYFLEKNGYDYLIDKVRTSEVPYRY